MAHATNLKVEGPHCILILQILSQPGGGATLYTNSADFESTRGPTMVGAKGLENFGILTALDWLKAHC